MPEERIAWTCGLDIDAQPAGPPLTGIICTVGPRTSTVEMICALRRAGMRVMRLNFSHGTHEYHAQAVANARASTDVLAAEDGGNAPPPLAIALDTKGPEIRTGGLRASLGGALEIGRGHVFVLSADEAVREDGDAERVFVDYADIGATLGAGGRVYVDDGNLQLEVVESLGAAGVRVRALNAHRLLPGKGVNLPYAAVRLPSLTDKDRADLAFAAAHGLDIVFASFVRRAEDVAAVRAVLASHPGGGRALVVAKIESHEGVRNVDAVLAAADGIMVARGDLGVEVPAHKVFVAQKMMIARANVAGKPVICATQMLESMTRNPRPTRAEASDVANAVLDGADCVMLSAETASGAYPVEAVATMAAVCVEAEATIAYAPLFDELRRTLVPAKTGIHRTARHAAEATADGAFGPSSPPAQAYDSAESLRSDAFRTKMAEEPPQPHGGHRPPASAQHIDVTETIACSAVNAAFEPFVRAIVVLTTSGATARQVARFRPCVPVIAVTRDARTARQLQLHRGVLPVAYERPPPPVVLVHPAAGTASPGSLAPLDAAAVEWQADVDARFAFAIAEGRRRGILCAGDGVVLIQGPRGGAGRSNTLRIITV